MSNSASSPQPHFRTTVWTEVFLAAKQDGGGDAESDRALQRLCEGYWYPIYAFIRQQGSSRSEAEDLAQGFFLKVLDKRYLGDADRSRGKFRTFLLASLKNFMANERDARTAMKRGGGQVVLQLDFDNAESRYAKAATDSWTAEAVFDRAWAIALLERVIDDLEASYQADGREQLFTALRGRLLDSKSGESMSALASQLETTTGALKVALHRMRKDYRQRLILEVAATVGTEDDVDSERNLLMRALAGE